MLSYRRELDGLRALALIAVIVYHANLKAFGVQIFQGGFFGVDVFFVLSGYLITGIIRRSMDKGTFSFRDFYWRRAKRIVPALVTMLVVTSALAYLILLPSDLITYAKSLQSALFFGSNHFFYGEDSYTAVASIYKPLLHTWSLSVEWQFYTVFPLIVWGVNKFFPRYLFGSLFVLALISLQASSFIVKVNPDMAFYLLPTRSWELILGGLVTFYDRSNIDSAEKGTFSSFAYQSLPVIGIFLIAHSMIFVGHEVNHPSFITLLPVLGTCLFIMFSHKGEISNDVLSLKPIVGVGLISYSLYLWHQPVFVFFRLIKHDNFRFEQFLLLLIISIILSLITYYFIESVFRKKVTSKLSKAYLTISIISCIVFSIYVIKENGFPERFPKAVGFENYELDNRILKLNSWKLLKSREKSNPNFLDVDNKILIVGNSHAKDLFNAFEQNKEQMKSFDFLRASMTQINCANENISGYSKVRDSFYSSPQYRDSTAIVISTRYGSAPCRKELQRSSDIDGLPFLIKKAKSDGKIVVVFGNTAEFHKVNKQYVADYIYNKHKDYNDIGIRFNSIKVEASQLLHSKLTRATEKNEKIELIAKDLGVKYFDKVPLICGSQSCSAYTDDGYKTFYDYGHWTLEGAAFFGQRLINYNFLMEIK